MCPQKPQKLNIFNTKQKIPNPTDLHEAVIIDNIL